MIFADNWALNIKHLMLTVSSALCSVCVSAANTPRQLAGLTGRRREGVHGKPPRGCLQGHVHCFLLAVQHPPAAAHRQGPAVPHQGRQQGNHPAPHASADTRRSVTVLYIRHCPTTTRVYTAVSDCLVYQALPYHDPRIHGGQ